MGMIQKKYKKFTLYGPEAPKVLIPIWAWAYFPQPLVVPASTLTTGTPAGNRLA